MTSKQTNMHEQNYFNGSSTKLSKAETNRNGGARRSDGAGKLVQTSNKTDALQLDNPRSCGRKIKQAKNKMNDRVR